MGGKSLVLACALLAVLASPALAQQKQNERETTKSTRTEKVFVNTTETRDKVQKRFQSGTDVFVQEAERTHGTKHWRLDTFTTFEKSWQEYVSRSRDVWGVVGQEWVYPCPGPGYWRDVYGWKSETYEALENRSQIYEAKTRSDPYDEVLPDQIGQYRTVSRLSVNGGGDNSTLVASSGRSSEIGFSGDTSSGASSARQASASKSKSLSGASKGTTAKGSRFVNLAGTWTGGLLIEGTSGRDKYKLTLGSIACEAEYDTRTGKLVATGKRAVAVDLTVEAEGTGLTGTFNGVPASFKRL